MRGGGGGGGVRLPDSDLSSPRAERPPNSSPRDMSRGAQPAAARTWSMVVVAPTFKEYSAAELRRRLDSQVAADGEGGAGGLEEEDISDEAFAARHQVVLLKMKSRIDELKKEFGDRDVPKTQKRRR